MGEPYQNTISGLLTKRAELMGDAQKLREALASVSNDIDALDRTLKTLGHDGDLKGMSPRGTRVVFHRNELRRFLIDQVRRAAAPISARELADMIISREGKDGHDRALCNDMVKRVGRSLKLLRKQEVLESFRDAQGVMMWRLAQT